MSMRILVTTPARIEVDQTVTRISGEATIGSFTLLPRHIDFVAALTPGLLSFESEAGDETFLAVDGGTIVKVAEAVRVSTPRAVRGDLGELDEAIRYGLLARGQQETLARTALEKIEADFVRRFVELEHE